MAALSSVDGYGGQKKVRRKVKFRKKLKLWRLRESEWNEDFEGVNNKCYGIKKVV